MITFLLKGLWRDPSRSLFPLLTVVVGVLVTVFLQTYLAGVTSNLSWTTASYGTGHLKVSSKSCTPRKASRPPMGSRTWVWRVF